MKFRPILAAAAATAFCLTSFASANLVAEAAPQVSSTAVSTQVDGLSAGGTVMPAVVSGSTVVYQGINGTASAAFSSTDLNATFGDNTLFTDTGRLEEFRFSTFNSGSSMGNLLTATYTFRFFDFNEFVAGDESTGLIGGFTGTATFGDPFDPFSPGLAPGTFSTVNFTGLDGLATPIDFLTPEVVITQELTATTGGATRLGVVGFAAPAIGAASSALYIEASTVGGGTPGFYSIGNPAAPFTTGFDVQLTAIPEPATAGLLGVVGMAMLRRRSK
jgi:hypothetical protein